MTSTLSVLDAKLRQHLCIGSEVSDALERGAGIVSVESTIVSSYEKDRGAANLYDSVCQIIRSKGAIPALVAVMDGIIHVGMSDDQVGGFARKASREKLGVRDLAAALVQGKSGSTTVSSTIFCSSLAGVQVAMTGAIGGVHRGYESTLDVSADLDELSKTKVAIVCAGAKIILDLPRTLEYLETKGVPVIGFRTGTFPAYFCETELPVGVRLDSAVDVARLMETHWSLGIGTGLIVAVPPPDDVPSQSFVDGLLDHALVTANAERINGKAISPYLLKKLDDATDGLTTRLRQEALLDVAAAAAEVAYALSHQRKVATASA